MKTRKKDPQIECFDADALRSEVEALIGKPVKLTVLVSGRKTKIEKGVIVSVYPNLFLVEIIKKGIRYKSSHTFVDLFTERVTIELNTGNEDLQSKEKVVNPI